MTKTIGEHSVCAMLARHGWAPALTRDGLARTDILAVDTIGERKQIEVQVKAARGSKINWPLGANAQLLPQGKREWFVLVAIDPDPTTPMRHYVVPRLHIGAAAWLSHMAWRTEPGIAEGKRNATLDMARIYEPVFERYLDRWDLLQHSTAKAPILLPPAFHALALEKRVGLPPGHPWNSELPDW